LHWLDAATPAALVRLSLAGRAGTEGGYGTYLRAIHGGPAGSDPADFEAWVRTVLDAYDRFRVLCALREGEWGAAGLNMAIERALVAAGLLTPRGEWYEGRPVMATRNDAALGVFNGDVGIVLRSATPAAPLRAYFLGSDKVHSVAVSRLAHVETAYAMTVHKSQGSEFEHAVLVLPPQSGRLLTRELVYTGVTRARRSFTLATPGAQTLIAALAQRTRRASGLLERLAQAPDAGVS
jgi:exodeoxyribonuclease V alpha subunit